MTNAQQLINSLTLEQTRQAIRLGYVNYNALTDEAKVEVDARMQMLLEHRDDLMAQRRSA